MTSRAVLRNVLLAAVVMAGVSAAAELELTDRTFEDAVAQHPNGLLVEFYAPWCGHCKALAPEFSAACAKLGRKKVNKEPVVPLPCAIIDAEKNTDVAKRYKISGFPWVKLFKARQPAGEPVNYPDNMPRKEASIVAWARQKAGRDVRQVGYSDELTSLRSGGGLLLLGVFGGEAGAAGARRAGEAELVGLSTEGEVSTAFAVHDVGAAQPAGGAAHESILTEALAAEVYADVDSLDRVMADDPREFALPAPALLAFLTTPDGVAHPPAALKPVDLWLATASDELLGEHGPGADAVAALVRQELELLYGQHSPTKAPEALKLLEKYQGNEIALLRAVRDKYGEDGDTALKRAVSVALLPRPVVEFSEAIRPWAFAHPSAYLCVLFRKKGDITHAPAEEEFHAAAAATSGMHAHKKLVFMQVDTGQFMNVAGHFGVKAEYLPTMLLVANPGGHKQGAGLPVYRPPPLGWVPPAQPRGAVEGFLREFLAGEATPEWKGAEAPTAAEEAAALAGSGGVRAVVRSTFEEKVLAPARHGAADVLVAISKSGCSACAELEPVLARLEAEVGSGRLGALTAASLPIYVLDTSANDIGDLSAVVFEQVDSFPTLALFRRGAEGKPVAKLAQGLSVKQVATFLAAELGDPELRHSVSTAAAKLPEKMAVDYKSQPAPDPAANAARAVKVATGSNFQLLLDATPGRDVLLELYAPWCGHCKELAPLYEEVGEAFLALDAAAGGAGATGVTVAKMDLTANDLPKKLLAPIKGYPTVRLFPAAAKAGAGRPAAVNYEGDRESAKSFFDFVAQHAASGFVRDAAGRPTPLTPIDMDEL